MVEGTPLLREHAVKNCIEGSNPSFSASNGYGTPINKGLAGFNFYPTHTSTHTTGLASPLDINRPESPFRSTEVLDETFLGIPNRSLILSAPPLGSGSSAIPTILRPTMYRADKGRPSMSETSLLPSGLPVLCG